MMTARIGTELERYGRTVILYTPKHPEGMAVKAVVQPERSRGTARAVPTPLGWKKQGRFIYLGPAQVSLESGSVRMEADGVNYVMHNAKPVYAGGEITHWWAVFEEAH